MTLRHALARTSLSVFALLGAAACSGGPGTSAPAPTAEAPVAATEVKPAPSLHGPAGWFFRHVDALDLRPEQRSTIVGVRGTLAAEMTPHHAAMRQELYKLADAVEAGRLDEASATEQKAALLASLGQARASFARAVNAVHDTLDGEQRTALVTDLETEREAPRDAEHSHGLAKIAFHLGLTPQQQAAISGAIQDELDQLFPDRKARREEWEAKTTAMAEAFVTDDFDAADYELGGHAEEAIKSFVEVATRGVGLSNRLLSAGQRGLAAEWIRSRVETL